LEGNALRLEKGGDVALEHLVGRTRFPAPDVPEIGPTEKKGPARPEESFLGPGRQDDPVLRLRLKGADESLSRLQLGQIDAAFAGGLFQPFDVRPDENRAVDPGDIRDLGFPFHQGRILGQAFQVGPGGDIGGQGEFDGRRRIREDDRHGHPVG
jgi:hypothetical protein